MGGVFLCYDDVKVFFGDVGVGFGFVFEEIEDIYVD